MKKIEYRVEYADFYGEDVFADGAYFTYPSKEIDDRTIVSRRYKDYGKAIEHATSIWERRQKDEWLAYLRVCECVIENRKVFKEEAKETTIHKWV